jgi:AMMECR1 domain-containing protein
MARTVLSPGLFLIALLYAVTAFAQEDVRKVQLEQTELKVIEVKCLACHNRERIDAAVKLKKDREKILLQMAKKGVVLTEGERRVMGHFWPQGPFKEKTSP